MKALLMIAIFSVATLSYADSDSFTLVCQPQKNSRPNQLGIENLKLEISNEDPTASVTIKYLNKDEVFADFMDYSSDSKTYDMTPGSRNGVGITLKNKKGQWTAKVVNVDETLSSYVDCSEKYTGSDLINALTEYLEESYENTFEGETDDTAEPCQVRLNKNNIEFFVNQKLEISALVVEDESMTYSKEGDSEAHLRKYNMNNLKVALVYVSDAYDTLRVESNGKSLTCGIYR
jgi:hypothetical protein